MPPAHLSPMPPAHLSPHPWSCCMQISAAIAQVLTAKLGVPADRFYLKFVDVQRSDFGWSGSTF